MKWSGGTESEAPRFDADELLISEGDLVGKTQEHVRAVGHRRDVEYVRGPATARPPGGPAHYLAGMAALASMRPGSPTARMRRSSASTSSPRREGLVSAAMSVAASCAGSSAEAHSSSA